MLTFMSVHVIMIDNSFSLQPTIFKTNLTMVALDALPLGKDVSGDVDAVSETSVTEFHRVPTSVHIRGAVFIKPGRPDLTMTLYTVQIMSPTTQVLWVIRERFSQLFASRKEILRSLSDSPSVSSSTRRYIMSMMRPLKTFPRRRLRFDDQALIDERVEGLTTYVTQLVQVRETCLEDLESETTAPDLKAFLHVLLPRIEAALDIPALHKEEETKWRNRSSHIDKQFRSHLCDKSCAICMEPFEDNSAPVGIVRLGCTHAFHHDCISTWLYTRPTCPLCRKEA
ncbi:hypothetical protein AeMF1_021432 [Aphanomyces euteiches]|nr:hypothetical protein AeMF1_021432 [Aphanomyces euteiches]